MIAAPTAGRFQRMKRSTSAWIVWASANFTAAASSAWAAKTSGL